MDPTIHAHPAADAWPMLSDDELDQLATDIAANGLMHPIVLDVDGLIIDGRNRLAACERAGVKPTFTTFEGDPVAFVLSSNEHRRHLKTGQRAIAVARTISQNWEITIEKAAVIYGLDFRRISDANVILEHAPDLADAVAAGTLPISHALEDARQRKNNVLTDAAKLSELQSNAPDLAEDVETGRFTVAEAYGAWKAREHERREAARRTAGYIQDGAGKLATILDYLTGSVRDIDIVNEYLSDEYRQRISAFVDAVKGD